MGRVWRWYYISLSGSHDRKHRRMKKKTLAGEKEIYALVATDICMSVTPNTKKHLEYVRNCT